MVLPDSDRVARAPPYSGTGQIFSDFGYATITLYSGTFQTLRLSYRFITPALQPQRVNPLVWPLSPSLAATEEISYDFFSSRYLDVSVPWVCFSDLCIQSKIPVLTGGFPHSDIHGSMLAYQLPVTSRRLLRLSSPLTAKASVVCSQQLVIVCLRFSITNQTGRKTFVFRTIYFLNYVSVYNSLFDNIAFQSTLFSQCFMKFIFFMILF